MHLEHSWSWRALTNRRRIAGDTSTFGPGLWGKEVWRLVKRIQQWLRCQEMFSSRGRLGWKRKFSLEVKSQLGKIGASTGRTTGKRHKEALT